MNTTSTDTGLTEEEIAEFVEYCIDALKDDFPVNGLKVETSLESVKLTGTDELENEWEENVAFRLTDKHDRPLDRKDIIEKAKGDLKMAMQKLSKKT